MATSLPVGSILTGGGRIGKWLWHVREEDAESGKIVRQALRMSICRYDPFRPGVDALASRIESKMWGLAKEAPDGEGFFKRAKTKVRTMFGRHVKEEALDFPDWREELEAWILASLQGISLADQANEICCHAFPESSKSLAERFPAMFHLEVENPRRLPACAASLPTGCSERTNVDRDGRESFSAIPMLGSREAVGSRRRPLGSHSPT
jgi:hypothetical protein